MAEKPARNPRSIAEDAGTTGEKSGGSYCGACGLPGSNCRCSSFKEWGVRAAVNGAGAGAVEEKKAFKLGGGS